MSVLRFGAPPAGAREAAPAFVHGSAAAAAQMIANGNKNLVASELHGRMMRADASRGPDPEAAAARHLERFKRLKSAGDDSGAALAADAAAAHMLQRISDLEQSESAPALQARITALAREIGYDPFLEQTLAPTAKALSRAAREGRFDDVLLLTDPDALVVVDLMERWNRGEDFLLNECALVSHDNALWVEVPCPRFGMATLSWLKDNFPAATWVNEKIPGALDHAAFLAAPAVACGAAGVLLTQAARFLHQIHVTNDLQRAVGSPLVVLKTLTVSGSPVFHCLMFSTAADVTTRADQMKAMAALGNKVPPNQQDFRRSLHIIVTDAPVAARSAVLALSDGAPYQNFMQAVPSGGVKCIVNLD